MAIPSTGAIRRLEVASAARFEKDILRVDTYQVGDRSWKVDRALLLDLASNFKAARANGTTIPVQWGHSNDARDRLGDILDLDVRGDTLYAVFDAKAEEDAKKLGVTANEVSVEVREPWTDGKGNRYPVALTHLAVVNLPVVPNQGPMLRLSLISEGNMSGKSTTRRLATDGEEEGGDASMISVKEVVAMLREAGKNVPDEVKTADELKLAWKVLNPTAASEEKPADSGAPPIVENVPVVQASLIKERDELKRQLSVYQKQQEETFRGEVEQLLIQGSLAAAHKDTVIRLGSLSNWDTAALAPYKAIPPGSAVKTQQKTRQLSTLGNGQGESEEEKKARARAAFK